MVLVSLPDPSATSFSPAAEAAWYAQLPTMFGAAGALFTNPARRARRSLAGAGPG